MNLYSKVFSVSGASDRPAPLQVHSKSNSSAQTNVIQHSTVAVSERYWVDSRHRYKQQSFVKWPPINALMNVVWGLRNTGAWRTKANTTFQSPLIRQDSRFSEPLGAHARLAVGLIHSMALKGLCCAQNNCRETLVGVKQ